MQLDIETGPNSQERSEFTEKWKGIKFSPDEVEELLKQEPACDRCLRAQLPCNIVSNAKLRCKACQTKKVVCPRNFTNIVRVLARQLGESEDEVRSKHARFMAPSTQKAKGKKDAGEVKSKKGESNREAGKTKGKEKEAYPRLIIPGGRRGQSNETRSERSDSRVPCNDDEMENDDDLETNVDIPGTSKPPSQSSHSQHSSSMAVDEDEGLSQKSAEVPGISSPQSHCSNLQTQANDNPAANDAIPAWKIDVGIPESSTSQPQHYWQGSRDDTQPTKADDNSGEMRVDTPASGTSKSSRSSLQIPDISLDFTWKRKFWDELSRAGLYEELETCETRFLKLGDVVEELGALRKKTWALQDEAVKLTQERMDATIQLKEAQSEIEQGENQRLELTSELSKLQREMEAITLERDKALSEVQQSRDLLLELQAARSEVEVGNHQRLEAESELSALRRQVKALEEERDAALHELQLRASPQESSSQAEERMEPPGPKVFGTDTQPDGLTAQGQECQPSIGLGEQQVNVQGENPNSTTSLEETLGLRLRLLETEKKCKKQEQEITSLRWELRHSYLYPSEYESFAREVQSIACGLAFVEASVRRDTTFDCEDFRTLIRNLRLSEVATSAKVRIPPTERGKYTGLSFSLEDADHQFPSPKRGKKRKERDGDSEYESRAASSSAGLPGRDYL